MSPPDSAVRLPLYRQFHALTKPRVIQLIVFCALIGMVLAGLVCRRATKC